MVVEGDYLGWRREEVWKRARGSILLFRRKRRRGGVRRLGRLRRSIRKKLLDACRWWANVCLKIG